MIHIAGGIILAVLVLGWLKLLIRAGSRAAGGDLRGTGHENAGAEKFDR